MWVSFDVYEFFLCRPLFECVPDEVGRFCGSLSLAFVGLFLSLAQCVFLFLTGDDEDDEEEEEEAAWEGRSGMS